jgi:thioredoxin 1
MEPLESQEHFEALIGLQEWDKPLPGFVVIWFSASWCGPCKRVNPDALLSSFKDVTWLKCDIDKNNYTAGYCDIRGIPAFLAIQDKKVIGKIQTSDTAKIIEWVTSLKA